MRLAVSSSWPPHGSRFTRGPRRCATDCFGASHSARSVFTIGPGRLPPTDELENALPPRPLLGKLEQPFAAHRQGDADKEDR